MVTLMEGFEEYIHTYKDKSLEWGVFDCTTLVYTYLDARYPGHKLTDVRGQYNDLTGAVRLAKRHDWIEELTKAFDIKIKTMGNDFDLYLPPKERGLTCAWVKYNDMLYSVNEQIGLLRMPPTIVPMFKGSTKIKIEGVK